MVFADWLQSWKRLWRGMSRANRAAARRRKKIASQVERLDQRLVLSAMQSDLYNVIAPQWSDPVDQGDIDATSPSAEWIIRFTTESFSQLTSWEDGACLLNVGELAFHIEEDLGLPGLVAARVTGGSNTDISSALAANPVVAYFEQNAEVVGTALPNDPKYSQQTELQRIGAAGAWNTQTGSSPQVVAVIDSGIDYTSPDLYLNIWLNQGEIPASLKSSLRDTDGDSLITFRDLNQSVNLAFTIDVNQNGYRDAGDLLQDPVWRDHVDGDANGRADDLIGWDFTDNDAVPFDNNGHGTHVSGILAATGNNSVGIAGVNWGAQIMVVKFLDQRLHGELTDAVNALNYVTQFRESHLAGVATAPDVRISNNSWEIRSSQTASAQSLNDAIAANSNSGMLLIAAAGNGVGDVPQNLDTDPFASLPAANPSPNVISVAAVDGNDQLLFNSNFGAMTVDLAAPGLDILSTEPGGNYGTRTGTSMATPFVSGAAALFWAQFPDATAAEVRHALLNGVDPVQGLVGKVATGGRLNLERTLGFDAVAPRAALISAPDITSTGNTFEDVTVRYTDNVAVNWSTLDAADIMVVRVDGQTFNPTIALQSTSTSANASLITATYRISAPNTKWTNADNGVYEVRWVQDQVADVVSNKNTAGLLGKFTINIPAPDDFRVTDLADSVDQIVGNGRIEDSLGRATLRAAIQEANSDPDANTIKLIAGTYTFTINGSGENASATGDLDVLHNLTIIGAGTTSTIIDAALLDRVFHVLPGVTLTLKDLTVRGGRANDGKGGGGILNEGTLILDHVVIADNTAVSGGGGGVLNNNTAATSGTTTLDSRDSTFRNNTALGADGGGVKIQKGDASLLTSTFQGNTAGTSGGGLSVTTNLVTVKNATFSGNTAGTVGGGLQITGGGLSLTNSTLTLNSAATAGGGLARTTAGTVLMVNTIAAGNILTNIGTDVDVTGAVTPTGSGSNFIGIVGTATGFSANATNQLGTNANPLDAQLALLGDYGGPTLTHRPNVGSPVIDAGAVVSGLTVDQRGLTRVVDGDSSGTATTDIGAVEFVLFSTISGTAYYDLNQNGEFDPSEQPLSGWTIYLDTNLNQLLDAGERSFVTGEDGKYLFTNVPPGNYSVTEVLQQSSIQSTLPTITQDLETFDSLTPFTNAAPVADPQSISTNANVASSMSLTGNDGDTDAVQVLIFSIVSGPAHGVLSGFNPLTGAVRYVPFQGYIGPDSFMYNVTDDDTAGGEPLTSSAVTVSIVVSALDYGDAPDTTSGTGPGDYQTSQGNNGPSHTLSTTQTSLFLGARVDGEADASPNFQADGDDSSTLPDDEGGVFEAAQDLVLEVGTAPKVRVRATNTTGSAATLYGWIDYNRDGVFDNATERTSVTVPDGTTNGQMMLVFPTIPETTTGGPTYARFRISSDSAAANPIGAAIGGEVEDYAATITKRSAGIVDSTKSKKIASSTNGGPALSDYDQFGSSVAALGDLDGDGVLDVAVGTPYDNTGGPSRGAIYVQFMNANGTVKSSIKVATNSNGCPILLDGDRFGSSMASLGDMDGDGVTDLVVGAIGDDTGAAGHGAAYVLFLNTNGTVKRSVKVGANMNGGPPLAGAFTYFGASVAALGDLDGDGTTDMAVGTLNDAFDPHGQVFVLLMNSNGTVKSSLKIASGINGGPADLVNDFSFGQSLASLGDLDGDGVTDLAVGAILDDTNGTNGVYSNRGAVYVLFLNTNGTVKNSLKIASNLNGGPALSNNDLFGRSLASVGDLDGDGTTDLAVGAYLTSTSGLGSNGAVHVLFLNSNGTVKNSLKFANGANGSPIPAEADFFGRSVAALGDLNGDGVIDLAVGASGDETNATSGPHSNRGAVHVLFLRPSAVAMADFGDAPDVSAGTGPGDYQTSLANNGPSHTIATTQTTLYLGSRVDGEADAAPNVRANGDDVLTVSGDEGGVFEPAQDLVLEVGTSPKVRLRATNLTASVATLYGWIDYNRDGVFDNTTERALVTVPTATSNGILTLVFPSVPETALGGPTYARFRLSSDLAAANAIGAAIGGEVEDYAATISKGSDGSVDSTKIASNTNGGPALLDFTLFGSSVAALGDLDGDGVTDLAVGAPRDRTGGTARGAVYIQFMNANGTVKSSLKIANGTNGGPTLSNYDYFGSSMASLRDLDGDGVTELAVGARGDDTGGSQIGAVYVLFLNSNGTVKNNVKLASGTNGVPTLANFDTFGFSVASQGDLDGDGVSDLAVGARFDSAVYVLLLKQNGTVKSSIKLANNMNGAPIFSTTDYFGSSLASLGDLDGDGVSELAVGAYKDDTNGADPSNSNRGAVHILFMNSDGTVKRSKKIANGLNGGPILSDYDLFGRSVASVGDLDGDGITDLAVGSERDDTTGTNGKYSDRGAVYLLLLNSDGTAKRSLKVASNTNGGPELIDGDNFGNSLAFLGDLDGDGLTEFAVGAPFDGTGGFGRGALYLLSLQGLTDNKPVIISTASPSIPENTTGVQTVVATDADLPAQTLRFTLTGGADQARFLMSVDGVLSFLDAPDYESPTDADVDNIYLVQVTVDDGHGRKTVQELSVTVTDANDSPTALWLSGTSLSGGSAAHSTIGTLTTTDPDFGNTFTYSLVSGTGSTDNSSFALVGSVLTMTPVTNQTTKSSYSARIRTTDQNGLSFEKPFTISVLPAGTPSSLGVPYVPANWSISGTVPWMTRTGGSSSAPNGAFIPDSPFASDSSLTSPEITVSLQNLQLKFQNNYLTELGHDGGVLEVSLNGGEFRDIVAAGGSFVSGGYNTTITTGRSGWSGNSNGYITSLINLPDYGIGSTLQFRWRFLSDAAVASTGWSIDTIQILGKQPAWRVTDPNPNAPTLGRHLIAVEPGTAHAGLNLGDYAQPGQISGREFLDLNQNGQWDGAQETVLPGWTVFLDQNENHILDPGELSTVTGSDGIYTFSNVPALLRNSVTAIIPTGWAPTAFPDDLAVSGLTIHRSVSLDAAQQRSDINFAVLPNKGELRGSIFNDRDHDGVRDAGEEGVPGITLFLDIGPQNDTVDQGEPVAVTNANGEYVFPNLNAYTSLAVQSKAYRIVELVDFSRSQLVQSLPPERTEGIDVSAFLVDAKFRTGFDISADGAGGFLLTGTDGNGNGFNQQDVYRVSPDGQTVNYFAVADHPQGITSDGTYAYWVDLNAELTQTLVYRQVLSGGSRELIYSYLTPGVAPGTLASATGLDYSGGSLVMIDSFQGQISQLPAQLGLSADQIVSVGGARFSGQIERTHAQFVDVENGVIYVADPGYVSSGPDHSQDLPARILSIPLAGGAYTTLFTGNLPAYEFFGTIVAPSAPRGLSVEGNTIYVTGDHGIYALPITGGTPTLIAADERFQQLSQLTWSQNSLYVIDNGTPGGATVWQVNLQPEHQTSVHVDLALNARSWDVTLTPGASVAGLDFARFDPSIAVGSSGTQSIRGSVFNDANGNGTKDDGEVGRSGVTVYLDLNRTGKLDEGDVTTVTLSGDDPNTPALESAGEYVFTGLETGLYEVLLADPQLGVDLTSGRRVSLAATDLLSSTSIGTPRAVATGDWSHDGLDDLAIADSETGEVTLWKNTGDQNFVNAGTLRTILPGGTTAGPVGGIPNSVTFLDLDGDSLLDLAIGRAQSAHISLWKNLGNGQFQEVKSNGLPKALILAAPGGQGFGIPSTVVSGDFNHDGRMDLAVIDSHPDHPRMFVFLRQAADFTFAAPQILTTPGPVKKAMKGLVAVDLNGDGAPDLATVVPDSNQLLVWSNLHDGSGRFATTPQNTIVGSGPTALAVVQANGDAFPDLAIANTLAGSVTVLANSGTGTFTTLSTLALTAPPTGILAANLDGKHGPDLAVTLGDGSDNSQPLVVFYHTGDTTSPYSKSDAYGAGIFNTSLLKTATGLALAASNLDRDQAPDLILVNSAAKSVSVLRNGPSTGGQSIRLATGIGAGPATGVNFGIQNRHTATWNPATGTLTVTLLVGSEVEVGVLGTQLQLRVQGVVDTSVNVAVADIRAIIVEGSNAADRIDLSTVSPDTGFTHVGGVAVTLRGNGGNDTITGSRFNDSIDAGEGNNVLSGGEGNDNLLAGSGDDLLFGGEGDDVLDGQTGANILDGGPGNNTLRGTTTNVQPTFTAGPDIQVNQSTTPQSFTGWATAINVGAPSEAGQVLNFLIETDNNALFSSGPAVTAGGTLTFTLAANAQGSAQVTVRLHDNGGIVNGGIDTSVAQTFTISVNAPNVAPTGLSLSPASIAENIAINSPVGTLSATDPNAGDTFIYTLVAGTGSDDNGQFAISDNILTIKTSANFESKGTYTIRVRVTDQDGLTFEKPITVTITNVNEAPTNLTVSPTSLPEGNAPNATVGALSTVDPDTGNSFTYSLVSGTGSTDNASFTISSDELHVIHSTDFETKSSYAIRIRVTDQGGLTFEKPLTVLVTDVVEFVPPTLSSPAVTVLSNKAQRTVTALPQIVVGGAPLGGGTLTISLNSLGKKKPTDVVTFASALGAIPAPTKSGSLFVWQFQLNQSVTAASVQSFLRSITFSTKGAGLRQLTRSLQIKLTNSAAQTATFNQTINVVKK